MAQRPPTLYDSTYTLHRLSPLHTPSNAGLLSRVSLELHARRLADSLRGDILQNGLGDFDDPPLRAGALKKCSWNFSKQSAVKNEERSPDGLGVTEGVVVDLEYENATYLALILRRPPSNARSSSTTSHFPLMLSRMPTGVRSALLDYLANAFDARAEPLHLDSRLIGHALEGFVDEASRMESGLEDILKDVQMSISFAAPVRPSLRSMDVTLKREDLAGFLEQGRAQAKSVSRNQNGADARDERGPFMRAVCQYMSNHLAIDMSHREVHISRAACGTFAIGREGRVKIFAPSFREDEALDSSEAAVRKGILRLAGLLLTTAAGGST